MNTATDRPGSLYLIATPIGNLEDITLRAKRILGEVDLVVAEDTRRTRKLLMALGLDRPLESFHGDSGPRKVERIVAVLREGNSVALASDAGTPLVADPGADLIGACAREGLPVVPIPGPSAVTAAIAVAGFGGERFLFAGYVPRRSAERRRFFEELGALPYPVVLFEAPHRIRVTLDHLARALGSERPVVVCRELTKLHEEIVRGTAAEVAERFAQNEPRGEFTIVIAPGDDAATPANAEAWRPLARRLAQSGLSPREVADSLALAPGISRNEAYALAVEETR